MREYIEGEQGRGGEGKVVSYRVVSYGPFTISIDDVEALYTHAAMVLYVRLKQIIKPENKRANLGEKMRACVSVCERESK